MVHLFGRLRLEEVIDDSDFKVECSNIRALNTIIFKSLLLQILIQICFVELVHSSVNGAEMKITRE